MLGPLDLLVPLGVLLGSLATFPFTLLYLPLTGQASRLCSWPKLRHIWFQHFWSWFGPASQFLFAGDVRQLLTEVEGTVLDIGPASGIWMPELGKAAKKAKINKIYGVEPNVLFHKQLLAAAKEAGLEGIYEPVAVYAEDLESLGIKKGSIDTIITVHVLCSVGLQQQKLVQQLYEYLKPGGQWLVYEHVASTHTLTRGWQHANNSMWGYLLDGCDLVRDTAEVLKNAGEWETNSLKSDPKDGFFEVLPHCVGKLVKKV